MLMRVIDMRTLLPTSCKSFDRAKPVGVIGTVTQVFGAVRAINHVAPSANQSISQNQSWN